jgi:hypothetical protein
VYTSCKICAIRPWTHAALLIDPVELADIEEAPAVAEYKLRKIDGSAETVPHSQVRRILGLPTM